MKQSATKFPAILTVLLLGVVMLGCIGTQNFVYSKGKVIGPGSKLVYPFDGPTSLELKVSGNAPFSLLIISSDGSKELFKQANVTDVETMVKLPEGSWKVIIRNEGKNLVKLDITIKSK